MRGRQGDIYSAYKRVASRDHLSAIDREEDLGISNAQFIRVLLHCSMLLSMFDFSPCVAFYFMRPLYSNFYIYI